MADLSDTIGSDLPTLSADMEKAFQAEEAAAAAARTAAKGGGHQRIAPESPDDVPEPAAKPAAAPAPAAAAPAAPPAPAAQPAPAAVVAAPPAPAGAAPAEDNDPDAVLANDGKRYVPLDVMLSRRRSDGGKIKDLEAALAKVNEEKDLLMGIAQGRVQPQPAAAPPAPPPEPEKNPFDEATHPFEHERWERVQIQKRLDAREAADKKSQEQQEHSAAVVTAKRAYIGAHKQFAAAPQNKDYPHAYSFITEGWKRVAMAQGMNEEQALEAAEQMEWNAVQNAIARKVHPSQVIWDIAKAAGWTAPVPAADPGAAPAAAAPAPAAPSPAKQIELAKQGAAAAISLSDAAGGAAPSAPTLASIAAMDKETFHAQFSGAAGDEAFRKLMSGAGRKNAAVA